MHVYGHRSDGVLMANFLINDLFVMLYFDAKNFELRKNKQNKK